MTDYDSQPRVPHHFPVRNVGRLGAAGRRGGVEACGRGGGRSGGLHFHDRGRASVVARVYADASRTRLVRGESFRVEVVDPAINVTLQPVFGEEVVFSIEVMDPARFYRFVQEP